MTSEVDQEGSFEQLSLINNHYLVKIICVFNPPFRKSDLDGLLQKTPLIAAINERYILAGLLDRGTTEDISDERYSVTYRFLNVQSYLSWERDMVLSESVNRKICHTIGTEEGKILCSNTGITLNKQVLLYFG